VSQGDSHRQAWIRVEVPASLIPDEIRRIALPELQPVRAALSSDAIDDPRRAVFEALTQQLANLTPALEPGARVALALGSRGLGSYPELVRGAVDALMTAGFEPFVMPAMGSHGGGTPEGQRRVLDDYGLVPEGIPVEVDDATTQIATLADGTGVHASRIAQAADAIVVLNRIKSHTGFQGPIESGLSKMLVIGLGKRPGAASMHAKGYAGFAPRLEEARELLLGVYPPVLGLAVVENADAQPALVEALTADTWAAREPELLLEAKRRMARLPFEKLDVLVVERAGKDISGLGMDPNVTGRFAVGEPTAPNPTRIALLSLTAASEGNASGMGHADVIPKSFAEAVDPISTWTNAITSTSLGSARMPMVVPDAETCVLVALATCGVPAGQARIAWIRDTSDLSILYVSASALEASTHPLEPLGLPERPRDGTLFAQS